VKFDGNLAGNWKVDFSTTNSRIFHQISIKFRSKENPTNTNKNHVKIKKKIVDGIFEFLNEFAEEKVEILGKLSR
jgi:hypothetical protein